MSVVPSCVGCGLVLGPTSGPTHPYMLSSPGCWGTYGELLAYGAGLSAVDAFAVQHPGVDEHRSRRSVAVHLTSLCVVLERGWSAERAVGLIRRAVDQPPVVWPLIGAEPPIGTVTVADVLLADGPLEEAVRRWAEDIWAAYEQHHDLVRSWIRALA